jgi:hypothetical protein
VLSIGLMFGLTVGLTVGLTFSSTVGLMAGLTWLSWAINLSKAFNGSDEKLITLSFYRLVL